MTGDSSPRAFVLGLDGVPWHTIERWIDDGHLPNLARLRADGVATGLASTTPASTPLAWPSIATGTWPDKHGVFEFVSLDGDYRQRPTTSADWRRPALWDLVSPAVVANVPMTYPAREVDGAMVTGLMTPDSREGFTHPPSLAAEIERRVPDYQVGLEWQSYRDRTDALPDAIASLVAARRDLMRLLFETVDDPRLSFVVYTAPDRLQHLLWEESTLLDHYRTLDEVVGEVRARCVDRDCDLYVVSDHGFGPVSRSVHVNAALADAGLLVRRTDRGVRGLLARAGVTQGRVLATLARVGVDADAIVSTLPGGVVDSVATRVPGDHTLYDVDRGRTRAFLHGLGSVYVNDAERFASGPVPPSEVAATRAAVLACLRDLRDPDTGDRVVEAHAVEEVYSGADARDGPTPDVVVEPRPGYTVSSSLRESAVVPADGRAGDHRSEGVFLAAGPRIDADAAPPDASVVDVAPTVLHGLGLPVPAGADGRVLEVFAPDSAPGRAAVETRAYGSTDGDEADARDYEFADVERRLRGLGYVE